MKSFVPKALVAIFVAFLLPIYWIAFHAPAVGIYHDDGIYLVTAKALSEGKGYRIISLPGEMLQTKYPILFPAVLSVAWKISPGFPENALFLKAIPFLSAMLWLWMTYRLIKEETGAPGVALWIVLLTAASSWVVFFSTTCMSETFFACFAAWALIRLKRLEGQRSEGEVGWPLLFSTMLVAAAFLTRTVGCLSRCGRGDRYVPEAEICFRSDVSFRMRRTHRSMAMVASGSHRDSIRRDRFLLYFVELQKLEYPLEFHRGTEIPCGIDKYLPYNIFTY